LPRLVAEEEKGLARALRLNLSLELDRALKGGKEVLVGHRERDPSAGPYRLPIRLSTLPEQ
jgi:hypothetical protein